MPIALSLTTGAPQTRRWAKLPKYSHYVILSSSISIYRNEIVHEIQQLAKICFLFVCIIVEATLYL